LHLLCDGKGVPLAVTLTAGQRHESTQFELLMERVAIRRPSGHIARRPKRVAADRGYHARRIRQWLRTRGIRAVIPPKKQRGQRKCGRPVSYNVTHYRARNVVERSIGWLKEYRFVATRFEKLAVNYLSLVEFAMIHRYLRILTAP
jgi:transposase